MDKEKICDSLAQNGGSMAVSGQIGGFSAADAVFIRSPGSDRAGGYADHISGGDERGRADYLPEFSLKFDMVSV